jgi:hypothetical protein
MEPLTELELIALEANGEAWREAACLPCDTEYRLPSAGSVRCNECWRLVRPADPPVFTCPRCLRESPTTSATSRLVAEIRQLRAAERETRLLLRQALGEAEGLHDLPLVELARRLARERERPGAEG